jgi:hypothetical protein
VLTAVAASGVRKGMGALVSALRPGSEKRAGGEGGEAAVPGALAGGGAAH